MKSEKITIGKKYPLKGLLTIPSTGNAPYPAVVLVQGSGSTDMDEKIYKIRPFKDIAEGLAKHGVAAIRYDKRTFTHAKKLFKDVGKDLTVKEETIEDAIFAADLLRKDPRIDPNKIFIIGHSLGGMLAPRIDAEGGNFAGLVLLAGSPRRLEEIMKEQQTEALKTLKFPLKWIVKKQIDKLAPKLENIYSLTDEEAKAVNFGRGMTVYYFKDMGIKTGADYLAESTKPVFVLHPENDLQVSLEKDFGKYKEILKDNPNATLKVYEGLNHAFMPALYNDISKALKEFKVARHVEEEVIFDIAEWVKVNG